MNARKTIKPSRIFLGLELKADKSPSDLDDYQFKTLLTNAMKDIFGVVGASTTLNVISYEPNTFKGIVEISSDAGPGVWASLSLISGSSKINVWGVSTFLHSLACPRVYE